MAKKKRARARRRGSPASGLRGRTFAWPRLRKIRSLSSLSGPTASELAARLAASELARASGVPLTLSEEEEDSVADLQKALAESRATIVRMCDDAARERLEAVTRAAEVADMHVLRTFVAATLVCPLADDVVAVGAGVGGRFAYMVTIGDLKRIAQIIKNRIPEARS